MPAVHSHRSAGHAPPRAAPQGQRSIARFCGSCGATREPGAAFCTACGHAVQNAQAQPPVVAHPHLETGVSALAAGEHAAAASALEAAVAEDPRHAVAHAYLGVAYLRLARVADARAEMETAVRLAPESFICRAKYGEFLARLGFYDQALVQLDLALAGQPPDLQAWNSGMELRQFCKDRAKGIFYRQTSYPRLKLPRLGRGSRGSLEIITQGEG